jgi:phenylalanyl-tRNA synthetase beta subunit
MNISGHPVHFFDADKVEGNIIVRNAKDGEEFTDLMGKTHQLIAQDIVIADEKKSLCLGGVMGGLNSGITEETKNILIEIANFDPVALRKTGVRLGLRTDSELRNEKNINPTFSLYCLLLLLDELKYYQKGLGNFEIGGLSYYVKQDLHPMPAKNITVDWERMEKFIFGKND